MNTKTFSIQAALSQGWELFKKRPLFFVIVPLLPAILSGIISWGGSLLTGGFSSVAQNSDNSLMSTSAAVVTFGVQLIGWLVSFLVSIGVQAAYLHTVEGKENSWADVFTYKHVIIPYFLASVIVGLVSVPAFLLLIIPGIIWALATEFYTFSLLTPGTGPIAAISESMRVTKGARLKLLLFSIVLMLVNILGVICLFIGVFVTIPVTGLALASVYLKLKEQTVSVTEMA